jgi:hypothetical protein
MMKHRNIRLIAVCAGQNLIYCRAVVLVSVHVSESVHVHVPVAVFVGCDTD